MAKRVFAQFDVRLPERFPQFERLKRVRGWAGTAVFSARVGSGHVHIIVVPDDEQPYFHVKGCISQNPIDKLDLFPKGSWPPAAPSDRVFSIKALEHKSGGPRWVLNDDKFYGIASDEEVDDMVAEALDCAERAFIPLAARLLRSEIDVNSRRA